MKQAPFRFLHAGDFRLGRPLHGVSEIPAHLRDEFIDAPYRAVQQVFQIAQQEQVAFMVLVGDLLDAQAGPRAVEFLRRQLLATCDKGISVYLAPGDVDIGLLWPDLPNLSQRIHVFSTEEVTAITHVGEKRPLARICGRGGDRGSWHSRDLPGDSAGLFSLGITPATGIHAPAMDDAIHYWALSGNPLRDRLRTGEQVAVRCGPPQGQSPRIAGPCGCAVIRVNGQQHVHVQFVATDIVRFHTEEIHHDADELPSSFFTERLHDRTAELLTESQRHTLITWRIKLHSQLASRLRRDRLAAEWLTQLRREFGTQSTAAWTVAIEVESDPQNGCWWEDESLLGDYLRIVQHAESREAPLPFAEFIPSKTTDVVRKLLLAARDERQDVYTMATRIGTDYFHEFAGSI